MAALLLGLVLSAATDDVELTGEDLYDANETFVSAHHYADNEFLYEEKLATAVKWAEPYVGRPVQIAAVVQRVSKESVDVTFFGKYAEDKQFSPQVRLVKDAGADVEFFAAMSGIPRPHLGGTTTASFARGSPRGKLKIGEYVPLELAKSLRRGDRLLISGTIHQVKPAPAIVGYTENTSPSKPIFRDVAGFVIVPEDIKKTGHLDLEEPERKREVPAGADEEHPES